MEQRSTKIWEYLTTFTPSSNSRAKKVIIKVILCVIVIALFPITGKVSGGRIGAVFTDGDSMLMTLPWGAVSIVLPIGPRDGDVVVADVNGGIVVKRLSDGSLVSENPNGNRFSKGQYEIRSTVVLAIYCPLYRPATSEPARLVQGNKFLHQTWENAAQAQDTEGVYNAQYLPRCPQGQLWIRDARFSYREAVVIVENKRFDATVTFEPPGITGGSGITTLKLSNEPGGKNRNIRIKVFPAKKKS